MATKIDPRKMPKTCPLCGGSGQAKSDLAARLLWLRKESGLSQSAFADRVGIKRTTVTNVETGRHTLTPDVIVKLCREFEVSSDWLLGIQ